MPCASFVIEAARIFSLWQRREVTIATDASSAAVLIFRLVILAQVALGTRGRNVRDPISSTFRDRFTVIRMRYFQRKWRSTQIASPAVKLIFRDQLFVSKRANGAFAPSPIIVAHGSPLFWILFGPLSALAADGLRVNVAPASVVAPRAISHNLSVFPVKSLCLCLECFWVCKSPRLVRGQNVLALGLVSSLAASAHLSFVLLIILTPCLLVILTVGLSVGLELRQVFVSMSRVICCVLNAPTILTFRSVPVRLGAVPRKRGDRLCGLARPAELFNTKSSQGVNLHRQVSFWSGSLGVSAPCGPFLF